MIIIQCDDLGWDDLGMHGNPWVDTPHLDKLGRESARLNDFTVNPTCAPSRATLLTGRHFLRTGVSHVHGGKDFLHLSERTLAEHFKAAGYATGMWGKWHSGCTEGYHPWQRGFDQAYTAQLYRHRETRGFLNGTPVEHKEWADVVITDYLIDFLRANQHQPFFAYLPTMTPHSPHDAPERWVSHYQKKGLSEALSRLWGMVSFLDEQVGRLIVELDQLGLADQTLLIFKSDNGPAIDRSVLSDEDRRLRKITGRRGWKGDLYENGVRSPLFMRLPDSIIPRDVDTPCDLVDLAPTILELANVAPMRDAPTFDGKSFASIVRSKKGDPSVPIFNYAHRGWLTSGPAYSLDGIPGEYKPIPAKERHSLVFEEQSLSVRQDNFKLILNPDYSDSPSGHLMLVDLRNDPFEKNDVADDHPEIRNDLLKTLRKWWDGIIEEPHAFDSPVFIINQGNNRIPARAPSELKGKVFNMVTELKGWTQQGDAACYRLFAGKTGTIGINFQWRTKMPKGATWTLHIPETGAKETTFGEDEVVLDAPEGEFTLKLVLDSKPKNATIPSLLALLVSCQTLIPAT